MKKNRIHKPCWGLEFEVYKYYDRQEKCIPGKGLSGFFVKIFDLQNLCKINVKHKMHKYCAKH